MSPASTTPANITPVDDGLAAQAKPGHVVPLRDPASAAKFPLNAAEAEREATPMPMDEVWSAQQRVRPSALWWLAR